MSNIIDPSHGIGFIKNNTRYVIKSYTQLDNYNDKLGFVVNNTPHYLGLSNMGSSEIPAYINVVKNNQELLVTPPGLQIDVQYETKIRGWFTDVTNFSISLGDSITLTDDLYATFHVYRENADIGTATVLLSHGSNSVVDTNTITVQGTNFYVDVSVTVPFDLFLGTDHIFGSVAQTFQHSATYIFIESTPIT